jgi:hypothetical protein
MRAYAKTLIEIFNAISGPKQQKKFRRLMLHRIKWSEETKGKASRRGKLSNTPNKVYCVKNVVLKEINNFLNIILLYLHPPLQVRGCLGKDLIKKFKMATRLL